MLKMKFILTYFPLTINISLIYRFSLKQYRNKILICEWCFWKKKKKRHEGWKAKLNLIDSLNKADQEGNGLTSLKNEWSPPEIYRVIGKFPKTTKWWYEQNVRRVHSCTPFAIQIDGSCRKAPQGCESNQEKDVPMGSDKEKLARFLRLPDDRS